MIDEEKMAVLTGGAPRVVPVTLKNLTEDELRALRADITAMLPADSLSALNLEQELVGQYRTVLNLQNSVLVDDKCPANQRAQVANATASALQALIKMQIDLRRDETFKILESCLVEAVKRLPDETKNQFLADYEGAVARSRVAA